MAISRDKPRGFRVSARTILQLGGELISSDGIAFYELIKNAVDAGAKKVLVEVTMRLPLNSVHEAKSFADRLNLGSSAPRAAIQKLKDELVAAVPPDAPDADLFVDELRQAASVDELLAVVAEANSITFSDTGSGMTLNDLETVYLTVGTPSRLKQREELREAGSTKVVLGEKGIGRLSAMRLGNCLHVTTATSEESHWNDLRIDWSDFGKDPDQLLDDVPVAPVRGPKKDPSAKGTTIRITDLNATWTSLKLTSIANTELSRFTDPFGDHKPFQIHLRFNGVAVPVPRMSEVLRENAHALVEAELSVERTRQGDPKAVLSGRVEYLVSGGSGKPLTGRIMEFCHSNDELSSLLNKKRLEPDVDIDAIARLGPFKMKCLWFNRRILKAIEVDDGLLDLKKLVRLWSGGLMVYRDGFRVPPYGGADDDWLDLDRGALAAQGYKVNRAQLIGKVDISSSKNPLLRDQTNREGLRDSTEKRALVALLKHILEVEFRGYLKEVDDEVRDRERISFQAFGEQLAEVEEKINDSLESLSTIDEQHPDLEIGSLSQRLHTAFRTVVQIVSDVEESVETVEDEKARVLHLAALGLSIEKLAHELNRASKHALDALSQITTTGNGAELKRTAALQLQSLRKRLQNLDPLLTPTRQRKETIDLEKEVRSVLSGFEARFIRHKIRHRVTVKADGPVMVKLVRAMLIQVLENLIDNSVYWLSVGKRTKGTEDKEREITLLIDGRRNVLEVSDNGPGIAPENRERIFRPFYTLKPAGQGKGLGLYIAREIAEYHGGTLKLLDKGLKSTGRLHTFELDFSKGRV